MPIYREAENAATDVLRSTWAEDGMIEIPVDPIAIAERMGVEVVETDLERDVSGAVIKEPGRDPVIYLERADSLNRQRFSCAHELGHLVARPDDEEYAFIDYRGPLASSGRDAGERFANAFAAGLLMPANAVRQLFRRDTSTAALAAEFGVSPEAMSIRLEILGLRSR